MSTITLQPTDTEPEPTTQTTHGRDTTGRPILPLPVAPAVAPLSCASCEVLIPSGVTVYGGLPFCCAGCVVGGPCTCTYDEPAEPTVDGNSLEADADIDGEVWDCLDVTALDEQRVSAQPRR